MLLVPVLLASQLVLSGLASFSLEAGTTSDAETDGIRSLARMRAIEAAHTASMARISHRHPVINAHNENRGS